MDQFFGGLIILLGFGSALTYVPLQIYTGLRWRGGWRIAGLVPLLLMVPVFVITAIALAEKSNLWPIILIFVAPVGTAYLVILFVIRWKLMARPHAG
ncbi:MAG TPA: hypothetical protein VFW73_11000 [Lacipirellulaceae bacterium]|nr:hypothetical protein [Lacipirellulaceae bacterium]